MLAFVLRLGAQLWTAPTEPVADEVEYLWRSSALVEGREVPGEGMRPPGSLWWYALLQWIGTPGAASARFANVLAGTAGVLLLGLLGTSLFDRRVGWTAALLAAVYPNFVMYSASLWSESLYVALALGGLLLLRQDRVVSTGLAGVAFGLAALTREVGVLLIALGPVLWWQGRGRTTAVVFVVAFVVTLAPWVSHLNRDDEPFALVTRTSYLNLFLGNAPILEDPSDDERSSRRSGVVFRRQREYRKFGTTPAEREAEAKDLALQAIADRMPAWPFEKTAEMIPALLTPNSLPAARLRGRPEEEGWEGRWSYRLAGGEAARDAIAWVAVASWCAVALVGVAGWVLLGRRPGSLVLAVFVAAHVLPVIITFGCSRFRVPVVPVLMLGVAWLLVNGASAWRDAGTRRRGVAVAAAALLAIVIGSMWSTVATPQWG